MAKMTQEELDARIAAAGGARVTHSGAVAKRKIPNPAADPLKAKQAGVAFVVGAPEELELDVEQWKSPEGHVIQAVHMPDGTWDVSQDEAPTPKPATATTTNTKPAGSKTRVEGTPTGQKDANGEEIRDNTRPVMVTRKSDGTVFSEEPLTPAERQQWEREKNGGKTDAEIATAATTSVAPTVNPADPTRLQKPDGHGGWTDAGPNAAGIRQTRIDDRNTATAEATSKRADLIEERRAEEAKRPDTKTDLKTINGQVYLISVTTPKDGSAPTTRYFGPDAQPVSALPVEGGGPQGPPLPNLVLGQVKNGLTAYRDKLNELVALGPGNGGISPAVATRLWGEAHQIGTMAITEAQTYENDEESRRNADVNLRTNAMTNAQSGFKSALDFVTSINGKLPKGSHAGGEAFAAILDLQQMQAQRMGAYDSPYSDSKQRALGLPPSAGSGPPSEAAAVAALTGPTATGPAAPAGPMPPNAIGLGAIGSVPAAGVPGAPVLAAPAASAPAPGPVVPSAPSTPSAGAPPAPAANGGVPTPGEPGGPPLANGPVMANPYGGPAATASGNEAADDILTLQDPGGFQTYITRANYDRMQPAAKAAFPVVNAENGAAFAAAHGGAPRQAPDGALQDQFTVIPPSMQQGTPPSPAYVPGGGGGNVQMAPPQDDFRAMAQFPTPQAPIGPVLNAPDSGPDMVAARRAQIAAQIPWRVSPEDIAWDEANGFGDWKRMPGAVA